MSDRDFCEAIEALANGDARQLFNRTYREHKKTYAALVNAEFQLQVARSLLETILRKPQSIDNFAVRSEARGVLQRVAEQNWESMTEEERAALLAPGPGVPL